MIATERKRKFLGLHVLTCIVGLVTAAGLAWQQYIIGPYYWSGLPLLENCLSGVLILAATITVCEWKMRRHGHFVKFSWCTVIAMAIVSVVFVILNFNPHHGEHGGFSCGFPAMMYHVSDGAYDGPAGSYWDIKSVGENVAWGTLLVLAAGLLAELAEFIAKANRRATC
ncbi:MAG: hypothetical protein IH991_20410 [Planctomycetes bacterium]|nr:hypothetical protein [Planctomycetota bacterium]